MDRIEISTDYLSKLAGMSKEEFLSRIQNEEGELNENYEETVSGSIHKKVLHIREDQRKRGFKEGRKEVEAFLQAQEITEYEDLSEALQILQSKFSKSPGNKSEGGSNLTLEEIQQLPEVQDWLNGQIKALQDKKAELEGQLKQSNDNFHSYKVETVAKGQAYKALETAKAVGLNQESIGLFLKAIGTSNLNIAADGNITVLDGDGQPMKDEYHNPVNFGDYVTSNWKFGFSEVPKGSGSPNHKGGGKSGGSKIVFRDKDHFNEEMKKADSAERRAELFKAYAEQVE